MNSSARYNAFMGVAKEINRLEALKKRARKLRLKIEIVTINWEPGFKDYFGIGPTRIRNFYKYLERNDGNDCKVATFYSLEEVEAFILSREMM